MHTLSATSLYGWEFEDYLPLPANQTSKTNVPIYGPGNTMWNGGVMAACVGGRIDVRSAGESLPPALRLLCSTQQERQVYGNERRIQLMLPAFREGARGNHVGMFS